jgi:hypothetical protein
MPTLPRTCVDCVPVTSQLKPTRGDQSACVFGFQSVRITAAPRGLFAAESVTIWFCPGVSRNVGTSTRRPAVTEKLGVTFHRSCTYAEIC